MTPGDWQDGQARSLAAVLGDDALLLVNGWWEPLDFTLPGDVAGGRPWTTAVDTAREDGAAAERVAAGRRLEGRSLVLLTRTP
jgi:glycogen operon protein